MRCVGGDPRRRERRLTRPVEERADHGQYRRGEGRSGERRHAERGRSARRAKPPAPVPHHAEQGDRRGDSAEARGRRNAGPVQQRGEMSQGLCFF